jgi:hypothetical protein
VKSNGSGLDQPNSASLITLLILSHCEKGESSTVARNSRRRKREDNDGKAPRIKRNRSICSSSATKAGQITKNYGEKKNNVQTLRNRIEALEIEKRMTMEEIAHFKFLVQI